MRYPLGKNSPLRKPNSLFLVIALLLVGFAIAIFFQAVFSADITVDPVAFSIGAVDVYWYGIFIASAVALGLPWAVSRAGRQGLNPRHTESILWLAIIGGVIGARCAYVVQNIPYFSLHPVEMVLLTTGGLSIHGALIGGFVAAFVSARRFGVSFWRLADAAMPAVLLGMIIGRLGNFTNHELFGPPTDLPWKLFIPAASRPAGLEAVAFYHPTFLYDAVLNALLLALILWNELSALKWPKRTSRVPGTLTLWLFIGIALTRFVVEFWRLGPTAALGLTSAQLVSLLLLGGAGLLLRWPAWLERVRS